MGIDIYMRWKGQSEEEVKKQFTGYCTTKGEVGYLREAYHGDPYVTCFLVSEAMDMGEAPIPASTLRDRLPKAKQIAIERAKKVYKEDLNEESPEVKAFENFVILAETKERETGEPVVVRASY